MEFRLLGPLEVLDDGRPVAVGAGKRRALLALLLLHANEVVPAERLIHDLWGERPPHTAAKSVHVYVSQLRREFGPSAAEWFVTKGGGYALSVRPGELDAHRFERALTEGETLLAEGDPSSAAERLRDGLALWRGPPLSDFSYEPFAQEAIARLEELRLVALESRIGAELELGRHAHVAGELEALVRAEPLREGPRRLLMLALYRSGRQADALEVFRTGRAVLVDELGLEPGPALRDLHERILAQDPSLEAPATGRRVRRRPDPRPRAPATSPLRARRGPLRPALVVASGILLALTTVLAVRSSDEPAATAPAPGRAANELLALDTAGRAAIAVQLPGRPLHVAVDDGNVLVGTVNSRSLTVADTTDGRIARTVPLRIRPDAVAPADDGVWLADGARGLVVRLHRGYQDVSARTVYAARPGARRAPRRGRGLAPRVGMVLTAGALWIADGSDGLARVDTETRTVARVARGQRLDAVAAGAGAVWAVGSTSSRVVRLDPATGRVTGSVELVGRRTARAPFPVAVAAAPGAVWVLNGNTATLTRVDPHTSGVVTNVEIGLDRAPLALTADATGAWVANGDGTVARVDAATNRRTSLPVGQALQHIAVDGSRLWVANAAVDHHVSGGAE